MKQLKSWGDLSNNYSMVLFNECIKLENGKILDEWLNNHTCDSNDENPCECEPYQWYLMSISEYDVKYLNKEFDLDIFYSDTLDNYILPVYHFGTGWDILALKGGYIIK